MAFQGSAAEIVAATRELNSARTSLAATEAGIALEPRPGGVVRVCARDDLGRFLARVDLPLGAAADLAAEITRAVREAERMGREGAARSSGEGAPERGETEGPAARAPTEAGANEEFETCGRTFRVGATYRPKDGGRPLRRVTRFYPPHEIGRTPNGRGGIVSFDYPHEPGVGSSVYGEDWCGRVGDEFPAGEGEG